MLLSASTPASSRIVGRDVDVGDQLVGFAARADVGAADQEGQVRGRLVGEELATGEAVLAEEEAVVGGEDDVGVAQSLHQAQRVEDQLDAVVDVAQRLELLVPVDAVGVDLVEGQVRRVADEARLVGDVALGEALRSGRAGYGAPLNQS